LQECNEALSLGANVAAVFRDQLPAVWAGSPVIDGDSSDIEMLTNKAKILGLKAKGQARKDRSGFVIDPA
jgi:hypothetical protein